jgi:ubiquinone/menaquinone biosynthesis C-methylase UbiE
MGLADIIAKSARAPSGLFGRVRFWLMGHETRAHNDIALELLDVQPRDRVLEIGFGHGRTLLKLAALAPDGFVAGVDHSPLMVRLARRRHRLAIERGTMAVTEATSARIPYSDADFDRICAVHTIYFWSDPRRDFAEIGRVLKDGGRLVLGFRAKENALQHSTKYPAAIYHFYDEQELAAWAREAGFDAIEFHRHRVGAIELVFICASRRR